jgi:exodeoxyribonuclease VII large subunit
MPETNYIRLSELNGKISDIIENTFGAVSFWVIADITNYSYRSEKNYHSFDLVEKDPDSNRILAKISGKAWGNGAARILNFVKITGQPFTENINVLINVSVQFHPVYGLQLNVNDIDPRFTLGVLEQQRLATLDRLVNENPAFIWKISEKYITRNSQLKLNAVIQRIAVISSRTSAGSEDFRHTLMTNAFGYQFFIDDYYTAVQGETNADQFLSKIIEVFQSTIPYDAVVITRGGGAQTDFLIFDHYKIGRAVAKFPIPVITGIGHQKNETITDLMANTQTKTPTKAAEFIIAHNKKYEDEMLNFQKTIVIKSQQLFSARFQSLSFMNSVVVNRTRNQINQHKDRLVMINQTTIRAAGSLLFKQRSALVQLSSQVGSKPKIVLYNRLNDVQNIFSNIKTFRAQYFKNQSSYLNHYRSVINIMSPENILNKGFALVKIKDKIISNPDEIDIGATIDIILSGTRINSTVNQKSSYNGKDFNL